MTRITVKINTASPVIVMFYRQSDSQKNLNQYEHDDMVSRWVNENTEAQRALNGSIGYLPSWRSE